MQVAAGQTTVRCGAQYQCSQAHHLPRLPVLRIRTNSVTAYKPCAPHQPIQQQLHAARQQEVRCRTQAQDTTQLDTASELVGEDAAAFDASKQSLKSWGIFGVLLTSVLGAMYLVSCFSSVLAAAASHSAFHGAVSDQRYIWLCVNNQYNHFCSSPSQTGRSRAVVALKAALSAAAAHSPQLALHANMRRHHKWLTKIGLHVKLCGLYSHLFSLSTARVTA